MACTHDAMACAASASPRCFMPRITSGGMCDTGRGVSDGRARPFCSAVIVRSLVVVVWRGLTKSGVMSHEPLWID